MKKKLLITSLFGFVSVLMVMMGCGPKPHADRMFSSLSILRQELDQRFSDPAFSTAYWGVVIQSLDNGQYFYKRNENKGFMPASNMKLYTTASALVKLGPDYRYQTTLVTNGLVEEDVLRGDLIIHGKGDPSITGRYHNGDPTAVFKAWADSLKELGIKKVEGRIIGDDNYFEDEIMGRGWSWDYQSDWYAAQISALSFNDNCVDITFQPADTIGGIAKYSLQPNTRYVQIHNQVKTVRSGLAKEIRFERKRATNDVTITGSIAIDEDSKLDWFSVENPTTYTTFVFKEVLERKGIAVTGETFDIDDLDDFQDDYQKFSILASYNSPPLSEILTTINKVSQNLYAELLLRTLGKQFTDVGDSRHGIKVVENVLSGFGIDPVEFESVDGSGLSRNNMITPIQTSILLREMFGRENAEYFYDSLPIAGIDGTIKSRMKGTAAENNVRAKTGYISRARALSGYVTTRDGEQLSFVMMVNNYVVPTSKANLVQDWVCERLANFHRSKIDR